jgi:hypothetical protein
VWGPDTEKFNESFPGDYQNLEEVVKSALSYLQEGPE